MARASETRNDLRPACRQHRPFRHYCDGMWNGRRSQPQVANRWKGATLDLLVKCNQQMTNGTARNFQWGLNPDIVIERRRNCTNVGTAPNTCVPRLSPGPVSIITKYPRV